MPDNPIRLAPTGAFVPLPYLQGDDPDEALFGLIAFALRYFGIETDNICRVLHSYGFTQTVHETAEYITLHRLLDGYDSTHGPKTKTVVYRAVTGPTASIKMTAEIEYTTGQYPWKITVLSDLVHARSVREEDEVICHSMWGQNIKTHVESGKVVCECNEANLMYLE